MIFTKIFANLPLVKALFRYLDFRYNNPLAFQAYFNKYSPAVIFATDVVSEYDLLLLKTARAMKVPDVGMVRSWDNPTNHGLIRVLPTILLCHNEIMKQQLIYFQDIKERLIFLTGIPQFEMHFKFKPLPKEEVFRRLGLDSGKRLIFYATAGVKFMDTDWQICEILQRLYVDGKIPQDTQFLIRVHPINPANLDRFKPNANVVIERPGYAFGEKVRDKEFSKADNDFFLSILHYSEVVIQVASSIMLEAAVMNKPIITIGFDGWEKKVPFVRSVQRQHLNEHYQVFFKYNASPVVGGPEELADWINQYLVNPAIDSEERKKFAEEQTWKFDGKASERIANYVSQFLPSSPTTSSI